MRMPPESVRATSDVLPKKWPFVAARSTSFESAMLSEPPEVCVVIATRALTERTGLFQATPSKWSDVK